MENGIEDAACRQLVKFSFFADSQQNLRYASSVKSEIYDPNWRHRKSAALPRSKWNIKSGCHFSCMEQAKGLQLVESTDQTSNIQLCSPDVLVSSRVFNLVGEFVLTIENLSAM